MFHLQNAKQHRDEHQTFWNKVIWSDETKMELFGQNHKHYIWRGFNKACNERYTTPTVKLVGGSLMFQGCVSYIGTGNLVRSDGDMSAVSYQKKKNTGEKFALISSEAVHCNMWMIQNRRPSRPLIGYSKMKRMFWSGHLIITEPIWVHARQPKNL